MTAAISGRSVRDRRLALDHRGDGHHVVGVRFLRCARAQVDGAEVLAERAELLGDELARRRPGAELVGRREQEALERLRVRAARRSGAGSARSSARSP